MLNRAISIGTLLLAVSIGFLLFYYKIFFPIWCSVLIFASITWIMLLEFRRKHVGLLMLWLWLCYALPFIHIVPYLWFDFDHDAPRLLWGLAVNPYMLDERIIRLTGMIGAIGGLGLLLGSLLSPGKINTKDRSFSLTVSRLRPLRMHIWACWILIGVGLSWVYAPRETILSAAYTTSASILEKGSLHFASAWSVSYIFLIVAFCDALLDHGYRRRKKLILSVIGISFVVIYLQLLRGDRESLPMVIALSFLFYYWGATQRWQRSDLSIPWYKITAFSLVVLVTSLIIGAVRSGLEGVSSIGEVIERIATVSNAGILTITNLLHGTWSAVLLTPLSVAGDYINHELSFKYGQTYLDLILSIPPGIVADLFEYQRPIDALHGPSWEMRYGIGGTHATVVPFMNFGMIGVLVVITLWSYLLATAEKKAMERLSVPSLSFLGYMATMAPHWLWYGEKYLINTLVTWLIITILYRIRLLYNVRPVSTNHRLADI